MKTFSTYTTSIGKNGLKEQILIITVDTTIPDAICPSHPETSQYNIFSFSNCCGSLSEVLLKNTDGGNSVHLIEDWDYIFEEIKIFKSSICFTGNLIFKYKLKVALV